MKNKINFKDKVITFAIINYRLSLESLFELFNIEKTEDITNKETINFFDKQAIRYILNYETINSDKKEQNKAKFKTMALITKIKLAKTLEEKIEFIKNEDDIKAIDIIGKDAKDLTEDEKYLILSYRYRHALKINDMVDIFHYHKN